MEKAVRDRAESETMGGVYSSKSGKYFGKGKPKLKKEIAKQQGEEKTVKKNLSLMSILLFPIAIAINFVGGQTAAAAGVFGLYRYRVSRSINGADRRLDCRGND